MIIMRDQDWATRNWSWLVLTSNRNCKIWMNNYGCMSMGNMESYMTNGWDCVDGMSRGRD